MTAVNYDNNPDKGGKNILLNQVVERFHRPLRSFFLKRLPSSADAEDYVQEVFVRLAKHEDLTKIERLDGYIFQIAANLLRDKARRAVRRSTDSHQEFDDSLDGHVEITPERVLISKQEVTAFVDVIGQLPERTRKVFILRRFENLRYAEIANRLGVSVSSVEKHMAKAVKHLDRHLQRD